MSHFSHTERKIFTKIIIITMHVPVFPLFFCVYCFFANDHEKKYEIFNEQSRAKIHFYDDSLGMFY
jgi:hypothetical protein